MLSWTCDADVSLLCRATHVVALCPQVGESEEEGGNDIGSRVADGYAPGMPYGITAG